MVVLGELFDRCTIASISSHLIFLPYPRTFVQLLEQFRALRQFPFSNELQAEGLLIELIALLKVLFNHCALRLSFSRGPLSCICKKTFSTAWYHEDHKDTKTLGLISSASKGETRMV